MADGHGLFCLADVMEGFLLHFLVTDESNGSKGVPEGLMPSILHDTTSAR